MIASTLIKPICIAGLLATAAQAAPPQDLHTRTALPDGYTEVPVEWEVQAFPNGEIIHLNGTAEQVHSELLKLNPEFDTDFANSDDHGDDHDEEHSLDARDKCSRDWGLVKCDIKRNYARKSAIDEGITYLRKIGGRPSLPAGPARCGRVSCSHSSGIWWCNDYNRRHTLGSYNSIANGARCIADKCESWTQTVKGQSFASGAKWNVMVHAPNGGC